MVFKALSILVRFPHMVVRINKTDYILKLQPADNCKLIVWEAIEVTPDDDGENNYTIIVKDSVLSSLFHILLWQNVSVFGKRQSNKS